MLFIKNFFPYITVYESRFGLNPDVRLELAAPEDATAFLKALPKKERKHFKVADSTITVDRWHWRKTLRKLEAPLEHFGLEPVQKLGVITHLQLEAGQAPGRTGYSDAKRQRPFSKRLEQPVDLATPVPPEHSEPPLTAKNGQYFFTENNSIVAHSYDELHAWAKSHPATRHEWQENQAKALQKERLKAAEAKLAKQIPFMPATAPDPIAIKTALQKARLLLASPQLIDAITNQKAIRKSEQLFRTMAAAIDDVLTLLDRQPALADHEVAALFTDRAHYAELISDLDTLWDIHDWVNTKVTLKQEPSLRESGVQSSEFSEGYRARPSSSWVHFKEKLLHHTRHIPFIDTFLRPNFHPRNDAVKSQIEEEYSTRRRIATNLPFFGVEFRKADKLLLESEGAKEFRTAFSIESEKALFKNRKDIDELIYQFRLKNGAVGRGERIGHAIKRHDKLYKVTAGITFVALSGVAFFLRILEGAGAIPPGAGGAAIGALKGLGETLGLVVLVDTILDIGHIIGTVALGEALKLLDQRVLGGILGKGIHYLSKGLDFIEEKTKGAAKTTYHSFKELGFRDTIAKAWSNVKSLPRRLKKHHHHHAHDHNNSKEALDGVYGQKKQEEHGHHHHHHEEEELHHLHRHHHRKKTIWELAYHGVRNTVIGKKTVAAEQQKKEAEKPEPTDLSRFMEHAFYLDHATRKHQYDNQAKRLDAHTVLLANWLRRKTYPDNYADKIIGTADEARKAISEMRKHRAENRKEPVMFHDRKAKIAALRSAVETIEHNDLGKAARDAEPIKRFNYATERVTHLLRDYVELLKNPSLSQLELDALDFLFSKQLRDTKELLAAHDRISVGRHYLSPKTQQFIDTFSHTSGTLARNLTKEMEDCILEHRIAEGDITVSRRFGKFSKDILEEFVQPRDIMAAAIIYPILRFTPGLNVVHEAITSATDKLFEWVGLESVYDNMGDNPVGKFGRDVIYAHGEQFKDTVMHFIMLTKMLSNDPEAKEHYDLHRRGLVNIANWAASHVTTPAKEWAETVRSSMQKEGCITASPR